MKVLFIGNSHTYVNDLPKIFKDIAKEDGTDISVTMITHPGWYLKQHCEYPEVRFNLLYGDYDYVVIQEHAHPFDNIEWYEFGVKTIAEFAKQAGTKMVLYATWAPKKNRGVQEEMSTAHRRLAEMVGAAVAPVDEAFSEVIENHPEVELYDTDGEHASLAGSTLAAKTIWQTINKDI